MMRRMPLLCLAALPLAAHVYPVTHGIFTALPGGARLRLRLSTHHLHPVLERIAGHRLAPKDQEAYDADLLSRYFADTLRLLGPRGESLTFTVVKQELDPTELVVTLEVLAPELGARPSNPPGGAGGYVDGLLDGWRLQNTVLMEASPRQKNLVTVEGLGARRGLTFDAQHRVLALDGSREGTP